MVTEEYANTYDHAERLILTTLSLNGAAPVALSNLSYDELGRLSARTLANGITESYAYNIRSWTTGIESDVFSENLLYETPGITPVCYGGNIASYTWSVGNGNAAVAKTFHNTYDALSRLTDVTLEAGGNTTANLCSYSYDAMGNITQLLRKGVMNDGNIGAIDDLEYTYSGNQLVCVSDDANGPTYVGAMHFQDNSDEAVEYTYDENGRLTQDLNKKISLIQYNAVSLPSKVQFSDGSYIAYLYDASGRKLRVDYHISPVVPLHPGTGPTPTSIGAGTVTGRADTGEASTASIPIIGPNPPIIPIRLTHTYTEYCGNHIFENGLLTMTLIPGGYISYEGGSISAPSFHFYLCDHEGNNRVVTDINGNIEQVNDYTPFGVLMKNDFTATSPQRYKYNGKELDRMHGLDLYDYGARLYDSPLGRWHTMDLLCEKYYNVSPYAYCLNNPVKFVDPDGRKIKVPSSFAARFIFGYFLKQITDDIVIVNKDGYISLSERPNPKRPIGTLLIRELVANQHTVYILQEDTSKNYQIDFDSTRAQTKGVGSDSKVNFSLSFFPKILTKTSNGNKLHSRPLYIGLAHELIHALRSMKGSAKGEQNTSNYSFTDENGRLQSVTEKTEELETVGIKGNQEITENKIRKEHGLGERVAY